ncbi:MAG: hypothetical protein LBJ96_01365, partial [Holosporaceae bacterium]|nr:hypothetical protein [Holosporaceae bacterium]
MKKSVLLVVWFGFLAVETMDSMVVRDGRAFSDLVLFPRSVQDGDGESARLFKDVVSSSFVVSGFRETEVDELCAEATRVLPVRLTMKAMRDVLGKACPNGVFSKFSDSNFSFLGRVFPSVYDMGR